MQTGSTTFWCFDCDSTFQDGNCCPYCGSREIDVADDCDQEYPGAVTDPHETSGPNVCEAA